MKDGLTQVKELKDKIHEQYMEIQELNKRVEDLKTINEEHQILNGMLRKENDRLNNIINELKEWFKGYHKSYASCKWYEEDYIEFIEHLENELKGEDKE